MQGLRIHCTCNKLLRIAPTHLHAFRSRRTWQRTRCSCRCVGNRLSKALSRPLLQPEINVHHHSQPSTAAGAASIYVTCPVTLDCKHCNPHTSVLLPPQGLDTLGHPVLVCYGNRHLPKVCLCPCNAADTHSVACMLLQLQGRGEKWSRVAQDQEGATATFPSYVSAPATWRMPMLVERENLADGVPGSEQSLEPRLRFLRERTRASSAAPLVRAARGAASFPQGDKGAAGCMLTGCRLV